MWSPPWQALGARLVDCAVWGRTGSPAVLCTQGPPARLNAPLRACAPLRETHLDVEVGRVEAAGRDQPCLGCPQVLGHQLSGSLHQELTVALGRHHPATSTSGGDSHDATSSRPPPPWATTAHARRPANHVAQRLFGVHWKLRRSGFTALGLLSGAPEPAIRVPGSSVRLGP